MREPGCDDDVDNVGPVVHGLRLLDAAANYCALGEPIFWLRGKFPLVPKDNGGNGFHDATADSAALVETFKRYPGATGIGMPIKEGTFVLDIDPRKGGSESLRALEAEQGSLPTTEEQITGSDGQHLVFATTREIRQLAGFRPGLDTRAAGRGYIVVEPSIHPTTRKRYRWVRRMLPAHAPQWLIDLIAAKPTAERVPYVPPVMQTNEEHQRCICNRCKPQHDNCNLECCKPRHERCICKPCFRLRYGKAVLAGVAKKVSNGADGERNNLLNWAWHKCAEYRYVIDKEHAHASLLAAALACGLDEREALKVLR